MSRHDRLYEMPPLEEPIESQGFGEGLGSELHLADYLQKLRRRWKLVALLVVVSVLGAGVLYVITPKQYQATARIQIERKSLSPVSNTQNLWLESWWNMEYYPTQYELLKSRGLAEKVVVDLGLADDAFFNPNGRALLAPASGGETDPEALDARVLGRLAQKVRSGVDVTPVRSTQLVDITYRSSKPQFAARVANGFADAFIEWGITTRQTTVGRASSFLASQIDALKREVQDKEGKLRALSRETDILALDETSNPVRTQLESFNRDYIAAKAQRIEAEARYKAMLETPQQEVADRTSDGTVSELMREQMRLEREYQTKLQTYKPDWPEMVELRARLDQGEVNLQKVIAEEVERAKETAYAQYRTALRREQRLRQELEAQKAELLDQSTDAAELATLQVEIDTSQELLNELLRQQSETEVAARLQNTRDSNVRVVDRALVPGSPFRPSLQENLGIGLGLGLLLGIGAVFLIEYMDRTVKTPEEVERRLKLPNLAVIPDVGAPGSRYGRGYGYGYGHGYGAVRKRSKRGFLRKAAPGSHGENPVGIIEMVPHDHPRLSVSEAYRALRTALLLSSAQELKVVTVTSPSSGEGKTATSTNLAVVMAQLGRRVLLIDADLRKPRLHEVFKVSNRTGLVNILAGGEDPNGISVQTPIRDLSLIPSGPIPPNPSELLASERMKALLERARSRFDFVILDTPPVLAVTDATVLGSMTDGVVLTLRAGKVLREDAKTCRDRLLLAEVKILGTVLNRQSERSGGRAYHYYYAAYEDEASKSDSAA